MFKIWATLTSCKNILRCSYSEGQANFKEVIKSLLDLLILSQTSSSQRRDPYHAKGIKIEEQMPNSSINLIYSLTQKWVLSPEYCGSLIQDSHSESVSEWISQNDWTKYNALQIDFGNIVKTSVQLLTPNQGSGLTIWVKEWVNFIERLVQRQCSANWLWQHRKSICSAFNTKPCQNYIMVQNSTVLHWCCGTRFTLEQAQ